MLENILKKSYVVKKSKNKKHIIARCPVEILNLDELLPPKFQRKIDSSYVNSLAKSMSPENSMYFGLIHIACVKKTMMIIDGQHRLHAYKRIENQTKLDILVSFHICQSKDEAFELMKLINTNKPLKVSECRSDMEIMNDVKNIFHNNFAIFIKQTNNPRVPNINLDKLETLLIETKFIQKTKTCNIVEKILKLNKFYEETNIETLSKWGLPIHKRTQVKKTKIPFYLGLYQKFEWVYHLLYHFETGIPFNKIEHITSKSKSMKVKKSIRTKLWINTFGENSRTGECYVCTNKIDESNFHSGHIISRFKGGSTCLSNLKAICKDCNIDMGIENLETYKKEFDKQNQ